MAEEVFKNGVIDGDDQTDEQAGEVFKNGVIDGDDQTDEQSYDLDRENNIKIAELTQKIGVLEQEKAELIRENDGVKERIEKLTAESEEMKSAKDEINKKLEEMMREIEQSESDKKALQSIAARAVELETQVVRLQHDLITAISDGEEANLEATRLKKILEEKKLRVENLVKETGENESRVTDLAEKLRAMEVKVSEASEEKLKIEQETEKELANKEKEISNLKSDIGELTSFIEKLVAQNKQDEEMRNNESKEGTRDLEPDSQYEGVNGISSHSDIGKVAKEPLAFKWQAAIMSTGAFVAAAGAWYLRHRRQRLD